MIAYNKTWLQNISIQEHSVVAPGGFYITQEEQEAIKIAYPAPFYTPNLFIRIGLFILTGIIMIFTFGLLALICLNIIERAAGGLAVFFGMASFALLEYFIKAKKHFRSGVDDALCWLGAVAVFSGICLPYNMNGLGTSLVIFIITVAVALVLMSFERVRELGASILASAGIVGVILGFAAQFKRKKIGQ